MNDEPTQQQNIAQLVERLSNETPAARAGMSKTAAGLRSRRAGCNEPTPSPLAMLLSRHTRRREFIAGLVGAAAWPMAARAQQDDRVRPIGVLTGFEENDPLTKTYVSAFTQALADLGWTNGRNVRMDLRWGGGDINRMRALAQELVGLQSDVIVTNSTPATVAVQRETQTIPIVFVGVTDPVASGIVPRLDRPSGNVTGFVTNEASLGGKWLELLSEIAPGLKRAAIMFNPDTAPVASFTPSLETAARTLKVEPIIAPILALGREPGGGLVIMPDVFAYPHRASIILAATRNNVPVVSYFTAFARDGGLLSYGIDPVDIFRRTPLMSIASCAARSRPSYPFSCRQNTRWS
jgi:putative ABC transport system substrate-binding protein